MNDIAKPHRVGLVGAGNICEHHVRALRDLPQCEIVGVFDIDEQRARETASRLELSVYPSLEALVDAGAEVVHVLTPPRAHASVAIEAMERGCHVLIEKPLAEDLDDCDRVREVAETRGRVACVNHSLSYDPHVLRALDAVERGKVGKVVAVDILRGSDYPPYPGGPLPPHYRRAGYPFRDLGVHALYLFEAFLGPIGDVNAEWESLGGDPNLAFDEWRALVRCERGLGQFQLSWNVKPIQSQIIIHGTTGVLRVDLFSMFQARRSSTRLPKAAERLFNAFTDSVEPLVDVPVSALEFVRGKIKPFQGLRNLVRAFYAHLDDEGPLPVSLAEARRIVRWTEHVARAADADHEQRQAAPLSDEVDVLVTGATGGVGSAVVERLAAAGRRMRIFARRRPAELPDGVEVALGDLGDPDAVDRAVKGARKVVHVGAAMKGGWTDHECGTVIGTQNVVDACLRHRVDKLVHISSMSVIQLAAGEDDTVVSENTPYEPHPEQRGFYTQAKLEAERRVVKATEDAGLHAVILRPGQIFGGRIPLMTGAVARRVGGRFVVLGDGEVRLPLVYIDDVVDAVVQALDGELADGEIVQIIDEDTPTQNEVLRLVVHDYDKVLHVPRGFLFATGRLSEPMLAAMGRASPVSEYRLRSALAKRRFRAENADLLGWKPRVGVREGIARTGGATPGAS